jgi:TetR/AcrR family transcriptional regulator, repressor for uid operon
MATIAETRQRQILEGAAACFVQKGFHQSTMQEICRQAGLSPGSVYRYYRGKEEIIAALVQQACADNLALIEGMKGRKDIAQALYDLIDSVLERLQDQTLCVLHIEVNAEALRSPRMADIVAQSDGSNRDALAETLRDAQKKGSIDPSLDPTMTAELLIALMEGIAMRKGLNPTLDTPAHGPIIKTLITRFLRMDPNDP